MWNGRAGESWVRHNSLLEQLLAEPGRECMNLLPLTPAMQILDVGCGCGNQTLELAARLDASSTVIGVDISEPMLGLARELKAANDNALSAEVQFALGDASEPLNISSPLYSISNFLAENTKTNTFIIREIILNTRIYI